MDSSLSSTSSACIGFSGPREVSAMSTEELSEWLASKGIPFEFCKIFEGRLCMVDTGKSY